MTTNPLYDAVQLLLEVALHQGPAFPDQERLREMQERLVVAKRNEDILAEVVKRHNCHNCGYETCTCIGAPGRPIVGQHLARNCDWPEYQ